MEEVFTAEECAYLDSQELARLATVGSGGMPHVLPCSFELNRALQTIDCRGWKLSSTLKFRHVLRSGVAALVVDDVLPPFLPRFIEVRGRADAIDEEGEALIRIWPHWVIERGFGGSSVLRRRRVAERGPVPS